MGQEIERKFLVKGEFKSWVSRETRITQGYLSTVPERTVRIRVNGDKGFLTIKGIASASGASRFEWEKEISLEDANSLLDMCEPGVIYKTRFSVPEKSGLMFEVDEFYGENEGLIVAEIELPSEDHPFEKPGWLGKEVTGVARYYNASLIKTPFRSW